MLGERRERRPRKYFCKKGWSGVYPAVKLFNARPDVAVLTRYCNRATQGIFSNISTVGPVQYKLTDHNTDSLSQCGDRYLHIPVRVAVVKTCKVNL